MALSPGSRIGPYEIVGIIGSGGMGEVYRAHDPKLNRDVALKVLPATFGSDPERLARFRREAQVLAALNHPNIAHIHGFEDASGQGALGDVHALVMELVEGPTLAERIAHGPLPPGEALPIAKQIAAAMEAAHEQGIIHRDLKPANIKVKDDGVVKVLDFGLAKAMGPDSSSGSSGEVMNSPTLTARATELGVILGTAAYMAPEQAKGRPVDRRADIWAFGVVLFEMLTGRRGYDAEDISETLAAVLTREVDWAALPASTPTRLKALVRDCLVRDPKERLRDIGDARRELQRIIDGVPDPIAPVTAGAPAAAPAPAWQRMLPWAIAAAAVVAAVVFASMSSKAPSTKTPQVVRSESALSDFSLLVAMSHDGTRVSYAQTGGPSTTALMIRRTNEFAAKPIAGTGNGLWPEFSPDGQWIAFSDVTGSTIRKIAVEGGAAVPLGEGTFARGASWGADEMIAFGGNKGLMKIPAAGGAATALTTLDAAKGEVAHIHPQYLPDGKHLLFTVITKSGDPQFALLDLASGAYKLIGRSGVNGKYVRSGHLVYVRAGTLFAVPFDLATQAITGGETPVVEGISQVGPDGTGDYAVSDEGLLVYFSAAANAQGTTLAWSDRNGKATPLPGQPTRSWGTGRLSPDGKFVANGITDGSNNRDMWIYDLQRGNLTRLTFGGTNDFPVWTRDSRRIFFFGVPTGGKPGIYTAPADASARPVLVAETAGGAQMDSMTADGRTLVYSLSRPDGPSRLMVLTLDATGKAGEAKPLHDATAAEFNGQISPDGKWIAYASMESGSLEVYVHAFPVGGARTRLSIDGGQRPRWSADGKELLFWAGQPGTRLMSASIPNGDASRATTPTLVFQTVVGTTWDVTPDSNKFLIELTSPTAGVRFATVTNWFEELNARVKPKK
jgi:Tol biopolymer transport system component